MQCPPVDTSLQDEGKNLEQDEPTDLPFVLPVRIMAIDSKLQTIQTMLDYHQTMLDYHTQCFHSLFEHFKIPIPKPHTETSTS